MNITKLILILFTFILLALVANGMAQDIPQEASASPDDIRATADAWGYVFDTWWTRLLTIISLLINLGFLSTKSGRDAVTQMATLGKKKESPV